MGTFCEPISTDKEIVLCDDTSRGDDYVIVDVLYENEEVIVGTFSNEWLSSPITAMVYREDNSVVSNELRFYYARN